MAEELKENVAPVAETEVKAEAAQGGEKSAANAKGNKRFGNGGRRFNRDRNGRGRKEEKLYEERVIKISRVAKTVKGGKRVRFTALVAGGAVRSILELAGVKNVYSKIYGARTQGNVVKATIEGLQQLKSYDKVVEVRYGKKPAVEAETSSAK